MENRVHVESFRAWARCPRRCLAGGLPLQQGTIDGQENPLSILVTAKLWQVEAPAHLRVFADPAHPLTGAVGKLNAADRG